MEKTLKLIASTGGKGGTGKSTFAILLAFRLLREGKKVVLCDLDVECPNDFLLLNQELENPQPIYQEFPSLNEERCKKCGQCSRVCEGHAIFWVRGKYPKFILDLCSGCGACWFVCPADAIEREKKGVGEIFLNKVEDNFWLITGRSKAGISETGFIVREVKERAIAFARKKKVDCLILDTSPGTHCNVIQALLNVDMAYVVTEPTPLGAHDLVLILQLIKKLGIGCEIVLNRCDIGERSLVEKVAKKFEARISVEIPYSEELIKAYCEKDLGRVVGLLRMER